MNTSYPEVTITWMNGKFYVNYYKDDKNFGMREGTDNLALALKNVEVDLAKITESNKVEHDTEYREAKRQGRVSINTGE